MITTGVYWEELWVSLYARREQEVQQREERDQSVIEWDSDIGGAREKDQGRKLSDNFLQVTFSYLRSRWVQKWGTKELLRRREVLVGLASGCMIAKGNGKDQGQEVWTLHLLHSGGKAESFDTSVLVFG